MRKAYSFLVPCSVSQFGSLDLRTLHRFIKVFHLLYSTQTTCSYSSVQDTHVWQVWLVADLTFPSLSICPKICKFLNCLRATAPAINYTCGYVLGVIHFQPLTYLQSINFCFSG